MLLIGIQCNMTHLYSSTVIKELTPSLNPENLKRLYYCYVPYQLCIKSHSALSAFLIYLKIQRVLLTSSISVASGGHRPALHTSQTGLQLDLTLALNFTIV